MDAHVKNIDEIKKISNFPVEHLQHGGISKISPDHHQFIGGCSMG